MTRLHCACALRHLAPQCHTQTCCEKFGVTLPPTIPFHWPLPVWQCAQSTFCHSSCDHGSKDTLPQTKQTRTMLHHWVLLPVSPPLSHPITPCILVVMRRSPCHRIKQVKQVLKATTHQKSPSSPTTPSEEEHSQGHLWCGVRYTERDGG